MSAAAVARGVAQRASKSWPRRLPAAAAGASLSPTTETTKIVASTGIPVAPLDAKHEQPLGSWTSEEIREAVNDNVMMTWMPNKARHTLPLITHGEGVYLYDDNFKQYLDWTSQAVCANLGHTVPDTIAAAIQDQLHSVPFTYGGLALTEIRARLANLLGNYLLPGDLQGAVFPSSGSEANEAAIVCARRYTGKFKVINWYRSYQ